MRRGLLHISEPKGHISHSAAFRRAAGHTKYTQAGAAGGKITSLDHCLSSFPYILLPITLTTAPSGSGFYDYHLIRQPAADTFPSRGRQGCRQDFVLNQHINCVLTTPQSALLTAPLTQGSQGRWLSMRRKYCGPSAGFADSSPLKGKAIYIK